MNYQVKKKFGSGSEDPIGNFVDIKKAKDFIFERLSADALYKVKAIYKIYQDETVIEEWTQEKWQKLQDELNSSADSDDSSGGGNKSAFSPTPMPTSPRPPGTPPPSWKREEDEDKDK